MKLSRSFIATIATCAIALTACGTSDASDTSSPSTEAPTTTVEISSDVPSSTVAPTTTVAPDPYVSPGWLAAENALPGTDAWRITKKVPGAKPVTAEGSIEGYADTTSAQPGDIVTLFVATAAPTWHVEAYRMGWYAGMQGRLIWTSGETPSTWQLDMSTDSDTKMSRALWAPSLTFTIDNAWPAGSYLLKLVSSTSEAHYVPLTIRRDSTSASLVVVSAVTTWQAYNPWGGCTLYQCFVGNPRSRATVVSFDRPYAASYNWGSADFLTHELPLISLIEELGIDTAYVTDIDLHSSALDGDGSTNPVLLNRTALLTTAHDEYYSTPMRASLERARDAGINLAFFGANAVYRHIRLEPNDESLPFRQLVNYRTADDDPMTAQDPLQSTVQWRNDPINKPESALIGIQYFAAGVKTAMKLVNTDNWVFAGVDLSRGTSLKNLVAIEADGLGHSNQEPENLEVLASSPVTYKKVRYNHAMTYYSADSGAGVFATGTIGWINALDTTAWGDEKVSLVVRGITTNVLQAFATGPAGVAHPSVSNASRYRTSVQPVNED
ncbi:unannotated protein [freshwater metagenome]|uniref:Unannotated protein n=1 Tax=freshwater metagenome TaxID=449393 RepID=A0A6J6WXT0_9ZZZZ|nr:hypothetical protein [Actinomycetota bacterium]MSX16343.1 hypothetical protein [Actinomycetota bacterium]MSX77820.1 hypothetical protein [Actinomycetota bacterium]MSZ72541.1 hypothetical protein [Actinomycetota bacterium]MUH57251.1 hypothetical protein [Actinomycetota bacterium]